MNINSKAQIWFIMKFFQEALLSTENLIDDSDMGEQVKCSDIKQSIFKSDKNVWIHAIKFQFYESKKWKWIKFMQESFVWTHYYKIPWDPRHHKHLTQGGSDTLILYQALWRGFSFTPVINKKLAALLLVQLANTVLPLAVQGVRDKFSYAHFVVQ